MAAMSEIERCAQRITKRTTLGTKGALKLLQEVSDRADEMRRTGQSDPVVTAAHDLASRKLQEAATARVDALRNAAKRAVPLAEIRAKGGINAAIPVLEAMEVWTPRGGGRLDSIEARGDWLARSMTAPVMNALRRDGLLAVAIQGKLDNEVAEAIVRKKGPGDPRVQVSTPAKKIADIIYPALEMGRTRLNGAIGREAIASAEDVVSKTNWDARQMRAAAGPGKSADEAFAAWWAKDGPRMAAKTFADLIPEEGETMDQAKLRFARAIFEGRTTGIVHTYRGGPGMAAEGDFVPFQFEGTRNLARSLSHQRTVFWNSARDWADHMREFGGGHSIYYNAINSLMQAGRQVALMDRLGTNPRANWNMLVEGIKHEYRGNIDEVNKFGSDVRRLNKIMDRLDGTTEQPANEFLAGLMDTATQLENMSKLGFVQATHAFAAPMTVSSELAHHGINHVEGVARTIGALLTGRGGAERQEILDEVGAYTHGGLAALHGSRSQMSPGVPGFLSWVHSNFMRATGLPAFIDRFQTNGVKAVLANKLGRAANFADLNVHIQALLRRYGIQAEDFDLLRAAEADGRKYMTPDAPLRVDDGAVEARLRQAGRLADDATPEQIARAVQTWKLDASDRLGMYLNDAAQHATVTPGARERAMVFGKQAPGSLGWMLARSFSQFKMWPLAAYNQILMREFGLALSKKQVGFGLGWILGLSMIGGAARMATRDFAAGRPQHDYGSWRTWLAALAQGGGLGLYGDFLFGETSRFGAGWVTSAMGPVAADIDTLTKMVGRFRDDLATHPDKAMKHMWPDLAHWGVSHVPFANLIYLKGALDYLVFYHIMEAASPGFWDRTNRRLLREQGRVLSGYEPGRPIPYTPWAIGAPTFQPRQ